MRVSRVDLRPLGCSNGLRVRENYSRRLGSEGDGRKSDGSELHGEIKGRVKGEGGLAKGWYAKCETNKTGRMPLLYPEVRGGMRQRKIERLRYERLP